VSHSTGQEIPSFSLDPKNYHLIHKSPPLDPILSRINAALTATLDSFNIQIKSMLIIKKTYH
jgi:hypothetical protein